MTRYVLGLDLRRLGDREVRIEFDPGDLSEAEGAVPTRYGLIEARWNRKEGGGLRYELTIPQCLTVKAEQGTELVVSTREGMIV